MNRLPRVAVECLTCKGVLLLAPYQIRDGRKYCSQRCMAIGRLRPEYRHEGSRFVARTCRACGKQFMAKRSEIARGAAIFCSRRCKSVATFHAALGKLTPTEKREIGRRGGLSTVASGKMPKPWDHSRYREWLPNALAKAQAAIRAVPFPRLSKTRLAGRAYWHVREAIKDGRLQRGPCRVCGRTDRIHAHHEDYSKPLDVIWLCARCHKRLHHGLPPAEVSA